MAAAVDDPVIIKRIAEALENVRTLLTWGGHLRAPDARGKREKPLLKLPNGALSGLQSANEVLREALALLGEEPGWSSLHADAIVVKMAGRETRYGAPPAVAPAEAMLRIEQQDEELAHLRKELDGRSRELAKERDEATKLHLEVARLREELVQHPEVTPIEASLEEAAEASGSDDSWTELSRFNLFCARMLYAGSVPDPFEEGKTLGPCIADDPTLPVYVWARTNGRTPSATLAEAATMYVEWVREVCALFRKSMG